MLTSYVCKTLKSRALVFFCFSSNFGNILQCGWQKAAILPPKVICGFMKSNFGAKNAPNCFKSSTFFYPNASKSYLEMSIDRNLHFRGPKTVSKLEKKLKKISFVPNATKSHIGVSNDQKFHFWKDKNSQKLNKMQKIQKFFAPNVPQI